MDRRKGGSGQGLPQQASNRVVVASDATVFPVPAVYPASSSGAWTEWTVAVGPPSWQAVTVVLTTATQALSCSFFNGKSVVPALARIKIWQGLWVGALYSRVAPPARAVSGVVILITGSVDPCLSRLRGSWPGGASSWRPRAHFVNGAVGFLRGGTTGSTPLVGRGGGLLRYGSADGPLTTTSNACDTDLLQELSEPPPVSPPNLSRMAGLTGGS